ncbi:MAG: sigma-70 family RNA polymerase sigma factor [Ignavibacteriales bacterium]|nr:sigma-70 family RNA polymerase sigma factor [Ignavibacteriales bacterium]
MALSDNQIIDEIRGGKRQYFTTLVDRHKDRAFTLAVRMLRNREEAEEAAQDAFIRAYNALNRFEGKARFSTWFYRILYNVCLTRISRRKDISLTTEFNDGMEYSESETMLAYNGANNYELNDTIEFIKKMMDTLPVKYQTILTLFYLQELSHDEIAEVTQMPIGTIKTHLFRARQMLQQLIQKEYELEKSV